MRLIIAGAGQTGVHLSQHFSALDHDVVLIDPSPSVLAGAEEELDVMLLAGDATHRTTLEAAQVHRADAFVAVSGSDADNLVAASLAKQSGAVVAVARVDDGGFYRGAASVELDVLGIDAVLCAPRLASDRLVERMLATAFDVIDSFAFHRVRIGLFSAARLEGAVGEPTADLSLPDGLTLVGVGRDGYLRVASDIPKLDADDRLLVVGRSESFLELWLRLVRTPPRAMIVGGEDVGPEIAQRLRKHLERIDLVEADRARAAELSSELVGVSVVAGDARQSVLLQDLQIGSVDHLVTATDSDEANLLVSLLGRRFGVPNTFTLVHQPGYGELFRGLDIGEATGIYEELAQNMSETLAAGTLVRRREVDGTGYVVAEWRLRRRTTNDILTRVADVPVPQRARIIAATRAMVYAEPTRGLGLSGRDGLLILVPRRDVDTLASALDTFDRSLG